MLSRRSQRIGVGLGLASFACTLACAFGLLLHVGEARARPADARPADARVTLYTIGPGSYLFSLYGHSVLCVEQDCFDYGLPTHNDPLKLVWHGLRGVPDFAPIRVDRGRVLAAFGSEERSIEAQELRLEPAARARLVARLERETSNRTAYAYNPWFDNCTTHLRDVIDEASDGKLRAVSALEPTRSFRDLSEAGFSGRTLPLLGIALAVGQGDRVGTPFERMFLPAILRDGVTSAFGVTPARVHEHRGNALQTSVHAGRALLVFIGVALAIAITASRKLARVARAIEASAALVLATLGVIVWGFAILTTYPEVARNWNLALLLPFDALIPFLPDPRARLYVNARITITLGLAALSLIGIIAQPLLVPALTALLPLVAIARARARGRAAPRAAVRSPV